MAESCDGTALTCPPDQRVPGPDTDGDGRNDLCDPCTGGGPVSSQRLSVRKLNASFQTSSVKISGTATMADPSAVDPIQHGLRVLIEDAAGVRRLDETAPPNGPTPMHGGWRVTGNGWSYKPATRSSAVRAVRLTRRPSAPGALEISIRIDDLFGTIAPEGIPVKATLVLDPPFATTGLCGEATFPGPPGVNPSCALVRDGETLACR